MRSKRAFSRSCSSSADVGADCPGAVMEPPSLYKLLYKTRPRATRWFCRARSMLKTIVPKARRPLRFLRNSQSRFLSSREAERAHLSNCERLGHPQKRGHLSIGRCVKWDERSTSLFHIARGRFTTWVGDSRCKSRRIRPNYIGVDPASDNAQGGLRRVLVLLVFFGLVLN